MTEKNFGYIQISDGIWYCEKDGTPWSSFKRNRNTHGYGTFITSDGDLKPLSKNKKGYYHIRYNGNHILWHRLVFKHFNGYMPKTVDHKDNNPSNNLIDNLQDISQKDNCRKCKLQSHNTSGYAGVSFNKSSNRWVSGLYIMKKRKHLGSFNTPEEAYTAYIDAKIKYHGKDSVKPLGVCHD